MVYIVICFIMGVGLIIATIMSIVSNGGVIFFIDGVNFFEIFYFLGYLFFSFFGLICIIAAIKDYRKLKDGDNKNTTTNETDSKENEDKE